MSQAKIRSKLHGTLSGCRPVASIILVCCFGLHSACERKEGQDDPVELDEKDVINLLIEDDPKAMEGLLKDRGILSRLDDIEVPVLGDPEPLLHASAQFDSVEIAKWLLGKGVGKEKLNNRRELAGEVALDFESHKVAELLDRGEILFTESTILDYFSRRGGATVTSINGTKMNSETGNDWFCRIQFLEEKKESIRLKILVYEHSQLAGETMGVLTRRFGYFTFQSKESRIH